MHVLLSVGWLGLVVAMLTIGLSAVFSAEATFILACYTMMDRFGLAIPIFAVGSILSGAVLSLTTPWGLVLRWWIVVKIVLSLVTVVTAVGLGGTWRAEAKELLIMGSPAQTLAWLLMSLSVLHLVMLSIATVISVEKPWGRTPWRREAV